MVMFLVRDVFRCKPGKAKEVASRFKRVMSLIERDDQFQNGRVMVDMVASYWTVVLEAECETLELFEKHQESFGKRPEVQEIMAGYMDLVDGGHREIYRLV
jgi:hypothetical protein